MRFRLGARLVAGVVGMLSLLWSGLAAATSEAQFRGLLDFTLPTAGQALTLNRNNPGDSPLDAYRLRIFAEGRSGEHLEGFAQIMANDAAGIYVMGAYGSYTPDPDRDLHVWAGKIPWVLGTYAPRTYSNKNPLVGTPLMFQHHTSMLWYQIPRNADVLLAARGTGQTVVSYDGQGRGTRGMPMVYDNCWDVGAVLKGSGGRFEYAAGFVNGTPGHGNGAEDENSGKSFLGRMGFSPLTGVIVGVSGSFGPYLPSGLESQLPSGKSVSDYDQIVAMADLSAEFDHLEIHAEGLRNEWQTPTVGGLVVRGGYLEAKYTFQNGIYAALRLESLNFSDLADSRGIIQPWDLDRRRQEFGVGYRVSREATVKAIYQRNVGKGASDPEGDQVDGLFAGQLSLSF